MRLSTTAMVLSGRAPGLGILATAMQQVRLEITPTSITRKKMWSLSQPLFRCAPGHAAWGLTLSYGRVLGQPYGEELGSWVPAVSPTRQTNPQSWGVALTTGHGLSPS